MKPGCNPFTSALVWPRTEEISPPSDSPNLGLTATSEPIRNNISTSTRHDVNISLSFDMLFFLLILQIPAHYACILYPSVRCVKYQAKYQNRSNLLENFGRAYNVQDSHGSNCSQLHGQAGLE